MIQTNSGLIKRKITPTGSVPGNAASKSDTFVLGESRGPEVNDSRRKLSWGCDIWNKQKRYLRKAFDAT